MIGRFHVVVVQRRQGNEGVKSTVVVLLNDCLPLSVLAAVVA